MASISQLLEMFTIQIVIVYCLQFRGATRLFTKWQNMYFGILLFFRRIVDKPCPDKFICPVILFIRNKEKSR